MIDFKLQMPQVWCKCEYVEDDSSSDNSLHGVQVRQRVGSVEIDSLKTHCITSVQECQGSLRHNEVLNGMSGITIKISSKSELLQSSYVAEKSQELISDVSQAEFRQFR